MNEIHGSFPIFRIANQTRKRSDWDVVESWTMDAHFMDIFAKKRFVFWLCLKSWKTFFIQDFLREILLKEFVANHFEEFAGACLIGIPLREVVSIYVAKGAVH